jgi:hypothetical protein
MRQRAARARSLAIDSSGEQSPADDRFGRA